MILLIGKLVGVTCLFGLAIRAFLDAAGVLAIGALIALVWIMRQHVKTQAPKLLRVV